MEVRRCCSECTALLVHIRSDTESETLAAEFELRRSCLFFPAMEGSRDNRERQEAHDQAYNDVDQVMLLGEDARGTDGCHPKRHDLARQPAAEQRSPQDRAQCGVK